MVLVLGRPCQRDRRQHASDQTTGPTRVGICLDRFKKELYDIEFGTDPFRAEGVHAKFRGDGDAAEWDV